TGWNYIATQGIAPVFIGEFGGRQVDINSKEGIWQRQLVDFVRQKQLSFSYWSWNPNSDDTGGILLDDWLSVDAPKQQLLQGLLTATSFSGNSRVTSSIPPTPKPQPSSNPNSIRISPGTQPNSNPTAIRTTPRTQPSFSVPTTTQTGLRVTSNMQSDWQDGFCTNLQVTNLSNNPVSNWQLKFQMNQATINNSWNGSFQPQGSQYVVTPADWGRVIEPGQTRELGFCANKLGSDYQPRQLSALVGGFTSMSQSNVSVSTTTQSKLNVSSNMQSDWQDGFCMTMQVSNPGNSPVRDWQVTFQMNQAAINNSWNGSFQPQGTRYVVTPADWGRVIEPGQSRELGFCANKLGSDYQPRQVSVSLR
ncbi:MAG TPA: cellulose binding domain-containing protein, partial [Coleofasciculaceae cyanobacterium]